MPVSVFETTESNNRREIIVTPQKPKVYRNHSSQRGGEVILVATFEDDTMALIMKISRMALMASRGEEPSMRRMMRFVNSMVVVRQGIEVVDYEPNPGRTELFEVQHLSTANN